MAIVRDWFKQMRWAALLLAILPLACDRPSAPPLTDGPAYTDTREGFRFLVPDGWKQRGRGYVPAGPVVGERMLVEYKNRAAGSTLIVTVANVPESASLSEYITKNNALTGENWRITIPAEDFTLNNAPAARITSEQEVGAHELIREIVVFRRNGRVYFFKGLYTAGDEKSRKALRTVFDTIVW
jgi:hypothetical protein